MLPSARRISRWLGRRVGKPAMFCSVAYERDWQRTVRVIDAACVVIWGEYRHCQRCWLEEATEPDLPDRVRRAQE